MYIISIELKFIIIPQYLYARDIIYYPIMSFILKHVFLYNYFTRLSDIFSFLMLLMYLNAWNTVSKLEINPSHTKGEHIILNDYNVNGIAIFKSESNIQ